MFKVISTIKIGENTAISVKSDGKDFANNISIKNELGEIFHVLSVAFVCPYNFDTTELLVEGKFEGKEIAIVELHE